MTAVINLLTLTKDAFERLAERPHSLGLRKYLFAVHMTLGLAASLYVSAISLSGALLVFREELESVLINEPRIVTASTIAPLSTLVRHVEDANPEYRVSGLIYSLENDHPARVYAVKQGTYISFLVNPYDGSILGPLPENDFLKFLQQLHFNLLLGKNGRQLNSLGAIVLFLLALTGVCVWWRGLKTWTLGLKINLGNGPLVASWHAHQAVGILVAPFLLVWGVSGFYFGFRAPFEQAINTVFPVAALGAQRDQEKDHSFDQARVSLDCIIPAALAACPAQRLVRISTPSPDGRTAKVWLTTVSSYKKDDNTEVVLDATSGKVLSISTPSARRGGDALLLWLTRLHFGNFAGLPLKCVWCLLGASPLLLSVTGATMWWRRQKLKNRINTHS